MAIKIQGVTIVDDSQNLTITGTPSFTGTTAIKIPVGTTVERPTPSIGQLRFNSEILTFEGYNGTEWGAIGGSDEYATTLALLAL